MSTEDWILVCDRSRASILHTLPDSEQPFEELHQFTFDDARLQPHEQGTDRPGRLMNSSGKRTAVEPHDDPDLVESRRFAKQLAETLQRENAQGRFDRLFVVAPPAFLGVLRQAFPAQLQTRVAAELTEEWMTLQEKDRQSRIAKFVASHS